MNIYHGVEELKGQKLSNAVAGLGNFDGIHIGHQELLARVVAHAKRIGGRAVALTFWPHPRYVLRGLDPRLITGLEERLKHMERLGIEDVLIFRFNREFSNQTAEDFVRDTLTRHLDLQALYVGFNYHFGKGKEGTPESLKELGEKYHYETKVVEPVVWKEKTVSSTRVRDAIGMGDLDTTTALLGRNYVLTGPVIKGDQIGGKVLGYPTANIHIEHSIAPASGVYAGWVYGIDGQRYQGAISIGSNPTFGEKGLRIEVFILNFDGDIYGSVLDVEFVKFIRGQQKFESPDELRMQIGHDIEEVKDVLTA